MLILTLAFNLVNVVGLHYHAQLIVKGAVIVLASALYRRLGANQGDAAHVTASFGCRKTSFPATRSPTRLRRSMI